MAVSARLWFHFCTAIGWLPAALNLFLPTAIREQSSQGQVKVEKLMQTMRGFDIPAETAALQFRPVNASQTCSSGQLMVLGTAPTKEKSNTESLLWIPANSWSF
jgi:hypothetical protein